MMIMNKPLAKYVIFIFVNMFWIAEVQNGANILSYKRSLNLDDLQFIVNNFFAKQFINFQKRDTKNTENKSLHTFNKC